MHMVMYGAESLSHHPNQMINGREVLAIQNEYTVDPIVQIIQMGAKHEIDDESKPTLWHVGAIDLVGFVKCP